MQTETAGLTHLRGKHYMSLMTFRKSGEPVSTPVWFAEQDGTIYLFTFPGAGKVKRIRHTARVRIAPCTMNGKVTGPTSEARARIITDAQEQARADRALARKYGLIWYIYNGLMGALRAIRRRPKSERVYVAIEPVG